MIEMPSKTCERPSKQEFLLDSDSKRVVMPIKKEEICVYDLIRAQAQFQNFCDNQGLKDFAQTVIARDVSGPEVMEHAINNHILLILADDSGAEEFISKMKISKRF
jgi:hypothetical protein